MILKIKELKQKAQVKVYSHGAFGEDETYYRLDEDKFANLIISECIKSGDILINHYIDTHNEQEQAMLIAAISDYQTLIKQHFGIEQ